MTDSRLDDSTASHAILRRSLFFEKSASMTLLEVNGPNARKFHMTEDKMRRVLLGEASQHKENSGSFLRRVHLHRVLLGEGSCNQFPFALGLKLHGIPGMVFDANGQEWSFVMGAREKMRGDTVLFESAGDEKLMQTWEEEFPKWNADNLETVCAMQVPETEIIMVHIEHPVVQLLEKKHAEFGTTPPSQLPMTTPNWRNMGAEVFMHGCRWLRENILNKSTKTFDLSQLTLSFGKLDQSKFTDLAPSCFEMMPLEGIDTAKEANEAKTKYGNLLVQRCFGLTLRIVLEFRFAGASGAEAGAGGG